MFGNPRRPEDMAARVAPGTPAASKPWLSP